MYEIACATLLPRVLIAGLFACLRKFYNIFYQNVITDFLNEHFMKNNISMENTV